MNTELKKLSDYARDLKEQWIREDKGDTPPVVLAICAGEVAISVIAPKVDKNTGLGIAQKIKMAFDPDIIMMAVDAHFAKLPPGMTREDAIKMYPPGSMQRMGQWARDKGFICECLVCNSIDRQGHFDINVLPYVRKDNAIDWDTETDFPQLKEGMSHEGYIPDAMRHIMLEEKVVIDLPEQVKMMEKFEFSRERALFHAGRACIAYLRSIGCTVGDNWSKRHPEWTPDEDQSAQPLS